MIDMNRQFAAIKRSCEELLIEEAYAATVGLPAQAEDGPYSAYLHLGHTVIATKLCYSNLGRYVQVSPRRAHRNDPQSVGSEAIRMPLSREQIKANGADAYRAGIQDLNPTTESLILMRRGQLLARVFEAAKGSFRGQPVIAKGHHPSRK